MQGMYVATVQVLVCVLTSDHWVQFGICTLCHVQDVLTSNPLDLMAASGRVYSGIHDILVSVARNVTPKAKTVSCGRQQECYTYFVQLKW